MQKIIEMRRHSARHHDQWGHLTQAGVELARSVGVTMSEFDTVITSPLPRAAETATAMGYGIDREIHDLAVVGKAAMEQIDWPMGFLEFGERMQAGSALATRGEALVNLLASIATDLPDGGSALIVSHGAVIEMAAVAAAPHVDHAVWGAQCGHCEGIRLTYRDGQCTDAIIIRVEGATGR